MKTAMILAAGRGERLKPLTEKHPKAMCLIHQKPLIEYHVERLAASGFERIVINHAYLGGQIRRYLGNGSKWNIEICYAPEPPGGLETGGGIFNALPLLGNNPFITVNADVFTDYDFSRLTINSNAMLHVVLVSNPQHKVHGDFDLLHSNQLDNSQKNYTFSGIACYRPEAFWQHQMGRYSVVPLLNAFINKKMATGELYQGLWIDIGSSERLQLANKVILEQRASASSRDTSF